MSYTCQISGENVIGQRCTLVPSKIRAVTYVGINPKYKRYFDKNLKQTKEIDSSFDRVDYNNLDLEKVEAIEELSYGFEVVEEIKVSPSQVHLAPEAEVVGEKEVRFVKTCKVELPTRRSRR